MKRQTATIAKLNELPDGLETLRPLNQSLLGELGVLAFHYGMKCSKLCLPLALLPFTLFSQESIERLDPALDAIIAQDTPIETLCSGFDWAEGPVWDERNKRLLFSDVPRNTIYQWKPGDSEASVFMKPSGFTGPLGYGAEPGSNGLAFDKDGRLILCEHGDRRLSILTDGGGKMTLADRYQDTTGYRFNSPNDLTIHSSGAIYFTDPPYGLPRDNPEKFRELDFNGVFRYTAGEGVTLLTKELDRPNGIALSPDEKTLYVAQSHRPHPVIMAYPVKHDGTLDKGRIFFNAKDLKGPGMPDGMKVRSDGTVFATGPGGLLIIDQTGKLLGRVLCGRSTANLAFGPQEKEIYLTSDDRILRVALKPPAK
ncbi:SMP-30/gluconolactonase/LRE family protein [Haloferula chungangensis]|uniref:SMP-30/gluconolactonase/LRE family protein n=1 Tax=Haloferula chungangensis TaxID=1048331 RepID=A0ABW2L6Q9_9BACT